MENAITNIDTSPPGLQTNPGYVDRNATGTQREHTTKEAGEDRSSNYIPSKQGWRITRDSIDIFQQVLNLKRTAVNNTAYTALFNDCIIAYTALTSGRTVTLPAVSTVAVGKIFIIKDEAGGAAANNITIDGNGSETIDGAATKVISSNYGTVTIYSNGSAWFSI